MSLPPSLSASWRTNATDGRHPQPAASAAQTDSGTTAGGSFQQPSTPSESSLRLSTSSEASSRLQTDVVTAAEEAARARGWGAAVVPPLAPSAHPLASLYSIVNAPSPAPPTHPPASEIPALGRPLTTSTGAVPQMNAGSSLLAPSSSSSSSSSSTVNSLQARRLPTPTNFQFIDRPPRPTPLMARREMPSGGEMPAFPPASSFPAHPATMVQSAVGLARRSSLATPPTINISTTTLGEQSSSLSLSSEFSFEERRLNRLNATEPTSRAPGRPISYRSHASTAATDRGSPVEDGSRLRINAPPAGTTAPTSNDEDEAFAAFASARRAPTPVAAAQRRTTGPDDSRTTRQSTLDSLRMSSMRQDALLVQLSEGLPDDWSVETIESEPPTQGRRPALHATSFVRRHLWEQPAMDELFASLGAPIGGSTTTDRGETAAAAAENEVSEADLICTPSSSVFPLQHGRASAAAGGWPSKPPVRQGSIYCGGQRVVSPCPPSPPSSSSVSRKRARPLLLPNLDFPPPASPAISPPPSPVASSNATPGCGTLLAIISAPPALLTGDATLTNLSGRSYCSSRREWGPQPPMHAVFGEVNGPVFALALDETPVKQRGGAIAGYNGDGNGRLACSSTKHARVDMACGCEGCAVRCLGCGLPAGFSIRYPCRVHFPILGESESNSPRFSPQSPTFSPDLPFDEDNDAEEAEEQQTEPQPRAQTSTGSGLRPHSQPHQSFENGEDNDWRSQQSIRYAPTPRSRRTDPAELVGEGAWLALSTAAVSVRLEEVEPGTGENGVLVGSCSGGEGEPSKKRTSLGEEHSWGRASMSAFIVGR